EGQLDLDAADAGQLADDVLDLLLDQRADGAAGARQRVLDVDLAVVAEPRFVDEAEVHDADVQLGVEDPLEHGLDVVDRRLLLALRRGSLGRGTSGVVLLVAHGHSSTTLASRPPWARVASPPSSVFQARIAHLIRTGYCLTPSSDSRSPRSM